MRKFCLIMMVAAKIAMATEINLTDANNYSDLIYSKPKPDYLETNAFSRSIFSTTATFMQVTGYSTLTSFYPSLSEIGVRVNGDDYKALKFTNNGFQKFDVNLPGGSQIIEIITGPQSNVGYGNQAVFGSWPVKVVFDDESAHIITDKKTKRMVIYGDSISIGHDSTNPSLQAWPLIIRNSWKDDGSIIVYGCGVKMLNDDCWNKASCQNLANLLTRQFLGVDHKIIYMQVSTNDYNFHQNASVFQINYATLLDAIHQNDPTINIYAQTPTWRVNEGINLAGSTLYDFRDKIAESCNARANFCNVVDGRDILYRWTDYIDDHVHPSLQGQMTYANFVRDLIGIY